MYTTKIKTHHVIMIFICSLVADFGLVADLFKVYIIVPMQQVPVIHVHVFFLLQAVPEMTEKL